MHARIKICGITNPADAALAATLGADWIGLNFYPKSPRYVDEAMAKAIVRVLPTSVEPVALFVNELAETMRNVARRLQIRTLQVHGDLGDAATWGELQWVPAFSVRDASDLATIEARLKTFVTPPAAILIDAHVPGMFGGTGMVAPWHLLADFNPGVPIILAGGLTPDNVAKAIRIVRPYAVDVASGVESAPGKKDPIKVAAFIKAAKESS